MSKLTKQEKSWILYDCGNSAYSLAITTAILPIFYKSTIAADISNAQSTAYWGYTNTIAIILVAILAPILGTIADYKGFKKKFFTVFMLIGIIATAALGTLGQGDVMACLIIYAFTVLGFSGTNVFYDSFLVDVAKDDNIDKVSAYGFAFGYIASILPFILCLAIIMVPSLVGLTTLNATRASFIIVALWWALLSIPMVKNVKQVHYVDREPAPIKNSFIRLFNTFSEIRQYKVAAIFLLAYFFYIDGVHTIIRMSTVYGSDIGISDDTMLIVLLVTQIVAFPSAILFAKFAKKTSTKFMLMYGIILYTIITIFAYFMSKEIHFWILGILVGTAQGGIQALSRSAYGKLIPKENSAKYFGLYNILGKASAALGPFLIGFIAQMTNNSRFGILSLIILFIIGGAILSRIPIDSPMTQKNTN
ncbi:MFS transporter [Vallitalea okinawensis]|uniref:MFS transporter n=1 Tax=Vallitalea okinawensis TaxID=2078660 RepID=UPI000CFDC371|nr:MFS transporter [Vallitalea okinawensis]